MAKVNIDGKEFEFDDLTDEQKGHVVSLRFVQDELKRLQAQIAVFKTAERSYSSALQDTLNN
tara:strand:+ start:2105 stop:2290 length:186 start_codon:yes stop_codon:yes gene_type:complete